MCPKREKNQKKLGKKPKKRNLEKGSKSHRLKEKRSLESKEKPKKLGPKRSKELEK